MPAGLSLGGRFLGGLIATPAGLGGIGWFQVSCASAGTRSPAHSSELTVRDP